MKKLHNTETLEEIDRAILLAKAYHEGQVDLQGVSYILHPLRVMLAVSDYEELMVGAVLHDVLEDTECTSVVLENNGISEENVGIIECLTRRLDEKYFDYIKRVNEHKFARIIKIADLYDNLRPGGPGSLRERYVKALKILDKDNEFIKFRKYVPDVIVIESKPKYRRGELVRFYFDNGREKREEYGHIEIIDEYRTVGQARDVSYDIKGTDNILYKHIPESDVFGFEEINEEY